MLIDRSFTRFAKEVKEKCGVKAKAAERKIEGWHWLGPEWPVIVWFKINLGFQSLREVIVLSTCVFFLQFAVSSCITREFPI